MEGIPASAGGTRSPPGSSCGGWVASKGVWPDTGGLLRLNLRAALLQEGEEDGEDDAGEGCDVVPVDGLSLEDEQDDYREDGEGDNLLDDFELDEIERAAVLGVADAVGRDGEAVFEERNAPREQDDQDERPAR